MAQRPQRLPATSDETPRNEQESNNPDLSQLTMDKWFMRLFDRQRLFRTGLMIMMKIDEHLLKEKVIRDVSGSSIGAHDPRLKPKIGQNFGQPQPHSQEVFPKIFIFKWL